MLKFFLIFITPLTLYSQNINHWETVVFEDNIWKYFEGIYEPDSNWRSLSFDDSSWQQGQGGIGYGDGDDNYGDMIIMRIIISTFLLARK